MSHPAFTGISRAHPGGSIDEPAGPWTARRESAPHERRGGTGGQRPGAGPKHDLVFTDRVSVTPVHLRHQLPHAVLAELHGLERSPLTRAIGEIRPLPAARGFAVPDRRGPRLHTPADVLAHAAAEGITLRIDGTETQIRRLDDIDPEIVRHVREMALRTVMKHTPDEPNHCVPVEDVASRAKDITVPVLAINGALDTRGCLDTVTALIDAVPNGRITQLDRAAHYTTMEQPEEFTRILLDFLREIYVPEG
ncbi:alpha/beta hydrolase [Streptomyces sp. NPDC096012]|uniref:alpha/beta fold hydrolase n=1 Tax=Streptomyces sp. NPDC096012 TaxID=3155684 RepID=UPI00336AD428